MNETCGSHSGHNEHAENLTKTVNRKTHCQLVPRQSSINPETWLLLHKTRFCWDIYLTYTTLQLWSVGVFSFVRTISVQKMSECWDMNVSKKSKKNLIKNFFYKSFKSLSSKTSVVSVELSWPMGKDNTAAKLTRPSQSHFLTPNAKTNGWNSVISARYKHTQLSELSERIN